MVCSELTKDAFYSHQTAINNEDIEGGGLVLNGFVHELQLSFGAVFQWIKTSQSQEASSELELFHWQSKQLEKAALCC